jgi:hypothetical protein
VQLGVTGRPLLSCLTLLKQSPHRSDLLAWAIKSLHDEGLAGDDLVLECAGRCEKLKEGGDAVPEGIAAVGEGTAGCLSDVGTFHVLLQS